MTKVFIVDDHEIIREGLKRILNDQPDITVVGEAENGNNVLTDLSDTDCDILLLDLNIPGRKGTYLIEDVKKKKPKVQILILSISPEDKYVLPLLRAGASGYLCKDSALNELVIAIRKVNAKGRYLSANLAELLAFDALSEQKEHVRKLTLLENSIMLMIAKGKEYNEIANELTLSVNSVTTLRRKVLEKLNLKNNVQIANYVLNNKLSNIPFMTEERN
jgi:DNA-binding NarL/FixJ family response regulator